MRGTSIVVSGLRFSEMRITFIKAFSPIGSCVCVMSLYNCRIESHIVILRTGVNRDNRCLLVHRGRLCGFKLE